MFTDYQDAVIHFILSCRMHFPFFLLKKGFQLLKNNWPEHIPASQWSLTSAYNLVRSDLCDLHMTISATSVSFSSQPCGEVYWVLEESIWWLLFVITSATWLTRLKRIETEREQTSSYTWLNLCFPRPFPALSELPFLHRLLPLHTPHWDCSADQGAVG